MGTTSHLRVKDVADLLGCSVSTVWSWVRKGYLPRPYRIGSRFSFWNQQDIENSLNKFLSVSDKEASHG